MPFLVVQMGAMLIAFQETEEGSKVWVGGISHSSCFPQEHMLITNKIHIIGTGGFILQDHRLEEAAQVHKSKEEKKNVINLR